MLMNMKTLFAVMIAFAMSASAQSRATGAFDVKLTPQSEKDAAVGRFTIDKQLHGDLEGTSKGEMLAMMTAVQGSAGYVAMEVVTGKLAGRSGTFALQHSGTMTRGAQSLSITIVPDSGTGELAGITGTMKIRIDESGKHFYELEYALPATK